MTLSGRSAEYSIPDTAKAVLFDAGVGLGKINFDVNIADGAKARWGWQVGRELLRFSLMRDGSIVERTEVGLLI